MNLEHFSGVKVILYSNIASFTFITFRQNLDATKDFISAHNISIGLKSGDYAGASPIRGIICLKVFIRLLLELKILAKVSMYVLGRYFGEVSNQSQNACRPMAIDGQ